MTPFAELTGHWQRAEPLLLPPSCLLCHEPVPTADGDVLVCALCRRRWQLVPDPVCRRCGTLLEGHEACTACADWPADLGRVRSAVWLDGRARACVHALKYEGWWRVAEAMALAMQTLEPLASGALLVPIPLGSRRHRRRGYNQSERLAVALAERTGGHVRADLLHRARETRSQTALTPEQRSANIAGAFAAAASVRGLTVVLVDDVFTTGATLLDAARALRAGGATGVDAVTFARAGVLL
jgi:ComF family protein